MENDNKLAKISLGLSVVLIILIIVLFTKLHNHDVAEPISDTELNDSTALEEVKYMKPTGKIAFFNLDSLNQQLTLFKDIQQKLEQSQIDAQNKMKNEQYKISSWEKKWRDKGQLLSAEQEQYMKEAQNMQQKAMEFEQKLQMELARIQDELTLTLAKRLSIHTKAYAEENGFDLIQAYQFGQSVWYYNPTLDITDDLAKLMNAEYAKSTGAVDSETTEEEGE